jgi:hypothetical protein
VDPTLAALLGAGLGAVATATVPFLTVRARRRDDAAAQRRTDTLAFLDVVIRMVKARGVQDWRLFSSTHSEAVVALERMLIGAPARDVDHLQRVANFAFERATKDENVTLATVGVEAMSEVLRRWCRGELKGRAIADAFEPALDVQFAKRGVRGA